MNADQYDWVDFYKELAIKLLPFRNKRKVLIDNIKRGYNNIGINLPTLERDNKIIDIDPFTIFALFNKNSLKETNRVKIMAELARMLNLKAAVPNSFDGIPTINNMSATFYNFIDQRDTDDIDNLWNLFESALNYAKNPSSNNCSQFSQYFDLVINKKGIGNSKLTMGLYWISPNSFLNLDNRNTWYIYESGQVPNKIASKLPSITKKISAKDYIELQEIVLNYINSDLIELKDFKELSFEAWRYSEEINNKIKKEALNNKGSALADDDVVSTNYWLYSPGEKAFKWDTFYKKGVIGIGWNEIGDLNKYSSKKEIISALKTNINPKQSYTNTALATWQFAKEMKLNDIIFVKKGLFILIGRGIVTSEYFFDSSIDENYSNFHKVKWTDKGNWDHPGNIAIKTLTNITQFTEYVEKLETIFNKTIDNDNEGIEVKNPLYDSNKFLEEVFMDNNNYKTLINLVRKKKNIILQGAPGVGKTFAAKRLAYSMIGEKNIDRVKMIQFHQSYTYEDFIEGFRPSSSGANFIIKKGSFYNFCNKAKDDLENEYFFLIDEINRGNLSKIFGELFMLIENDKRGNSLQLLYSDEKFFVPKNVYIIGMMNTADRSLAMMDYAFRRRFAFFELKPSFNSEGFMNYYKSFNNIKFNRLIDCIKSLNKEITNDSSLGEGFCIGHSYFCNLQEIQEQTLSDIVEYELIPLIKEYWFDENTKVTNWIDNLRSSIK